MTCNVAGDQPVVGFVLFPGFTALDLIGPHEVLARCASCYLIAESPELVTSDRHLRLLPDATLANCPKLDVLFVPGGPGQSQAMNRIDLIKFLTLQSQFVKWTASVCTGSLLLAQAGVLHGRKATTHWLAIEELQRLGAIAVRERVVQDGYIVTGAGVSAGIDLALFLVAALLGQEEAQRIQLSIEYDPCPPFDAGSPDKAPAHIVAELRKNSRFHQAPSEASG